MVTVNVHAAASVKSVEVLNGVQIKVTFTQPVYSGLSDGTTLTLKDSNNTAVSFTGAWVDTNNKTEYVMTTATVMSGKYTVALTTGVKNNTNDDFEPYTTTVEVKDTVAPTIVSTTYSDTGDEMTVKFSEPMQGTPSFVATRADGKALTDSIIVASAGNDSYKFTLKKKPGNASFTDGNTNITLTVTGIADKAGNVPGDGKALQLTANYDVAAVANATLVSITRTGLAEVTAQFSSKISDPGTISVAGNTIQGVVASDKTKVTYILPAAAQNLTGAQLVTVNGWVAFKAPATPVANAIVSVDFTYSKIAAPVITKLEYVPATTTTAAYFLATYDKDVTVADLATAGTVNVTTKLADGTISSSSTTISANAANTNDRTVAAVTSSKITLAAMPAANGTYTYTLPATIAKNKDGVANAATTFTVVINSFTAAAAPALPAPTVAQSNSDNTVINVSFSKKVDIASAETLGNYSIAGATISSATVTANGANGATVALKVSVPTTGNYAIVIGGVKGYDNSYSAMATSTQIKMLKDTVAPTIASAKVSAVGDGSTTSATITVTFSELVTLAADTDNALEVVVGATTYKLNNASAINGTTGVFTVTKADGSLVDASTTATILTSGNVQVVKNGTAIVDASGNAVANSVKIN